jgi:5'-deoxynucleotidase YfbR-like HD superfamily hydrolase
MASPYIQTFTGKQFFSLEPRAADVDIVDICHSLSLKCRFAGHCSYFYSVAQHSVLVMNEVIEILRSHANYDKDEKRDIIKWALMHDAGEAYFSDIPNPIKKSDPLFDKIEDRILEAVAEHFRLPWPLTGTPKAIVKEADHALLATEARDLLPIVWEDYQEMWAHKALKHAIEPWSSSYAEKRFLKEYRNLFVSA